MKKRRTVSILFAMIAAVFVYMFPATSAEAVSGLDVTCEMPSSAMSFDPGKDNWEAACPEDSNCFVSSFKWMPSDGSQKRFSFQPGKAYDAFVTLEPKDGYDFVNGVTVTLNGEPVKIVTRQRRKIVFWVTASVRGNVKKVDLLYEVPPVWSRYDPEMMNWSVGFVNDEENLICVPDDSGWFPENGSASEPFFFENGSRYYIKVHLSPVDSWVLTRETAVTLNGKPAQVLEVNERGMTVRSESITIKGEQGKYEAAYGRNTVWEKGDQNGFMIIFVRAEDTEYTYDRFAGCEIDGKTVDPGQYFATREQYGSLELTMRPECLQTLSSGTHTVTALFVDGKGSTQIRVTGGDGSPKSSEPETSSRSESSEEPVPPDRESADGREQSSPEPPDNDPASASDNIDPSGDGNDGGSESGPESAEDVIRRDGDTDFPIWILPIAAVMILIVIAGIAAKRKK